MLNSFHALIAFVLRCEPHFSDHRNTLTRVSAYHGFVANKNVLFYLVKKKYSTLLGFRHEDDILQRAVFSVRQPTTEFTHKIV
jgi:hypothetical protein